MIRRFMLDLMIIWHDGSECFNYSRLIVCNIAAYLITCQLVTDDSSYRVDELNSTNETRIQLCSNMSASSRNINGSDIPLLSNL
jgi:hypothetical protein